MAATATSTTFIPRCFEELKTYVQDSDDELTDYELTEDELISRLSIAPFKAIATTIICKKNGKIKNIKGNTLILWIHQRICKIYSELDNKDDRFPDQGSIKKPTDWIASLSKWQGKMAGGEIGVKRHLK